MNSIRQKQPLQTAKNLGLYHDGGVIRFDKILSVPLCDRLPALVGKFGEKKIHGIISVMLTDFCNSFNVVRPMSGEQIIQCAYEIITTSEEDQLSVEDIALFFQGAKRGKYGKPVFDHLDQQVIFLILEGYREERYQQYILLKEEMDSHYKAGGMIMRSEEDANPQDVKLSRSANNLAGAMGDLKARYSEWKDQPE